MTISKYDPQKHHRRSIRLKGFDYTSARGYFVTLVAWQRHCRFGEVINGEAPQGSYVQLNKNGKIVEWEWRELPKRLPYISLGAYVVMPNHFHAILFIHETAGATRQGQTVSQSGTEPMQTVTKEGIGGSPRRPNGPKPSSLGAVIAQFKSRATKRIWKIPECKEIPVWQRNYYERIIRDETALQNITRYINANPLSWDADAENPVHKK
jgi:putative transposase